VNGIAAFLARWNAFPRTIRLAASIAALVAVIVGLAVAIAGHPARVALFAAPLHDEQLAEVEERLAAWNVSYSTASGNVLVDAGRRNDVLLRLSLAGVPHDHLLTTAEALSNIGALTPQSVIEAQTRAGLAGDIEAGLRGIDGVDDARVIVAPAKDAEFGDDSERRASASVRLRLKAGTTLTQPAVAGMRAFVAASVPELDAGRVTILDDRGVALADDAPAFDEALQLQGSLQSALDAAFGGGAAIVRVRAEYASARTSERDLRRSVLGPQTLARVRNSEAFDGGGKRYRKLDETEERGSEMHETIAQAAPGALKRLSAAVFVDQGRALDLAKVRALAAAALGFDSARGDALAVEAIDFHRELAARKDVWSILYGAVVPLAPAFIIAVGLFACVRVAVPPFAVLVRSLIERGIVDRAMRTAEQLPPAHVRSMLDREPPHAAAAIISALPAATATAVLELYPPHEREAIVDRMQRKHSPLLSDAPELLRRHG
jgi:flagellar M-ring protein FliF